MNYPLLKKGTRRFIYSYDQNTVLKIQRNPNLSNNFNLEEWINWLKVRETEFEKYFCPCIEYRKDKSLLMVKAAKINWADNKYQNIMIPVFITDKKLSNFGLWNNRVVCVDYHRINSLENRLIKLNGV